MKKFLGLLAVFAVALAGCNSAIPEAESGLARPLGVFSPTGIWAEPLAQVSINVPGCAIAPTMKLRFVFGTVAADGSVSGSVSANDGVAQPFQGTYDAAMGHLSGTLGGGKAKLEASLREPNRMRGSLETSGGCIGQGGQPNGTGTVYITYYATFVTRSFL
jgi:hypothetical protein